jgi:5-methylthioadenosine/S-adenosylhomocysteine deaminase
MVRAGANLAAEWGTPWHIHVAEAPYEGEATRERTGLGPLAWPEQVGALDERLRIVHGVWLEEGEIAALARAGGGLIHCPGSNLFLGDGIAPLPRYRHAGVPIALGCDSGSANSRLSIFGEMRLAATLQKGIAGDAEILRAEEVFAMGTSGGGLAVGQPVGLLQPGAYADLVALDLGDLSLQPRHDLLRNVVYAMESTAVRHVYVHGDSVVRDGRLVRQSEAELVRRVQSTTAGWAAGRPGGPRQ